MKAVINIIMDRKFSFERLFGDGGMPSGHSATVTSLMIMVGYTSGFGSPLFALSAIFAAVVMHDAMGVRRETGKHAVSIKELADRSFMSEVSFRKLFKKKYGVSPQRFIINLRMQNAAGLISTGYYSLKEVALMSGYEDYKYFSVEFKKTTGVSPSKYLYNYEG